jgi:hypothetical protein
VGEISKRISSVHFGTLQKIRDSSVTYVLNDYGWHLDDAKKFLPIQGSIVQSLFCGEWYEFAKIGTLSDDFDGIQRIFSAGSDCCPEH